MKTVNYVISQRRKSSSTLQCCKSYLQICISFEGPKEAANEEGDQPIPPKE